MTPASEVKDQGADPSAPAKKESLFVTPRFWVMGILALITLPLLKSLSIELPPVLAGMDSAKMHAELLEETGRSLTLVDLEGHLIVVMGLSLADGEKADKDFKNFRKMRKRLGGLEPGVVYLILVDDASPAELTEFVEAKTARKPLNIFALDIDHEIFQRLQAAAPKPMAQYLLLDTHGRLRGLCEGEASPLDLFVGGVGQLALWRDSDPEPAALGDGETRSSAGDKED